MTATRQATPGELQPQFACLEGNEWKVAHQHVNQFSSTQQSTTDRRWMPLQLYTYLRSSATRRSAYIISLKITFQLDRLQFGWGYILTLSPL
ncbi:uncharacterized protein BO88DRAFT_172295 [Aspergillus vadensis CBS 113365]|uniref:Uncharacterized protein n=1 Tax=Aspergillus vadensis (strain CBS 113365 / IMI 142717 / IBT 24658) TaxID=1448311 RepID=A0A319C3T1_ASPVC|nr:hypothetical protein BO88DRAFT_172295 [Aspergillus vadensis CBS 113365]PYH72903.1 hypothetical protein BO88DRAFT_172295 [Aspergillus vadensis CBS 113365]